MLECFVGDFGESAGEFESGGAGADDDEVEPRAGFFLGFGTFGAFESVEHLVAHGGGFFDGLQAGSIFAPFIFTVIGGLRTSGDDERVVGKDAAIGEDYLLAGGVDIHGFTEKDFDIFLMTENGAERGGNFGGRKRAGGDLIEERLEEMEVALVQERDLDVGTLEGLRGNQAAKTSAENHNLMRLRHESFPPEPGQV